jgi:hypothetical protein|tara:strand:+ start:206 stop:448 length:243 start_codon:yes stop_codon:yes gene_type:complete
MTVLEFLSGKTLIVIIIGMGILIVSTVLYMDWYDENVLNPRVWEDWSCKEMKKFALEFKDEEFTDVQQAKFHDDLSHCLS